MDRLVPMLLQEFIGFAILKPFVLNLGPSICDMYKSIFHVPVGMKCLDFITVAQPVVTMVMHMQILTLLKMSCNSYFATWIL